MIGIYKITCIVTDEFYIGQSRNIEHRWEQHRKNWRVNLHTRKMQNCYNLHGEDAFTFEVLELCTIQQLDILEQHYIDTLWSKRILNTEKDVVTASGQKVRRTKVFKDTYPKTRKPRTKRRITPVPEYLNPRRKYTPKPPIEYSEFDRKVYK